MLTQLHVECLPRQNGINNSTQSEINWFYTYTHMYVRSFKKPPGQSLLSIQPANELTVSLQQELQRRTFSCRLQLKKAGNEKLQRKLKHFFWKLNLY